jgi:steroid 5-alpha reductase family enzyme
MSAVLLLLVALAAACAGFALLLIVAKRLDNFGIVDIAWALGFAPVAAFYGHFARGAFPRRLLITAMAGLWSLRLGYAWKMAATSSSAATGRQILTRRCSNSSNFRPFYS